MVSIWLTAVKAATNSSDMKKTGFAERSRFSSNAEGFGLLAVLLDARGAQAGEAVLVDRILPGQEFFDGKRVAGAGFLERKQAEGKSRREALRCLKRHLARRVWRLLIESEGEISPTPIDTQRGTLATQSAVIV